MTFNDRVQRARDLIDRLFAEAEASGAIDTSFSREQFAALVLMGVSARLLGEGYSHTFPTEGAPR